MENVKYISGDLVTLDITPDEILRVISAFSPASSWVHNENVYTLERPDGNTFSSKEQYLKGIPLTPQILEANGWKEVPLAKGHYVRQQGISIFKNINGEGFLAQYEIDITINLDFVHQLQHLLFGLGLDSSLKV